MLVCKASRALSCRLLGRNHIMVLKWLSGHTYTPHSRRAYVSRSGVFIQLFVRILTKTVSGALCVTSAQTVVALVAGQKWPQAGKLLLQLGLSVGLSLCKCVSGRRGDRRMNNNYTYCCKPVAIQRFNDITASWKELCFCAIVDVNNTRNERIASSCAAELIVFALAKDRFMFNGGVAKRGTFLEKLNWHLR